MSRARIVAVTLLLALVGGAWLVWRFLARDEMRALRAASPERESASSTANCVTPIGPGGERVADAVRREPVDLSETASSRKLNPRLVPPAPDVVRQLRRHGRELCYGVVRAPDGLPCEGATIDRGGSVLAISDGDGAWRAEVDVEFGWYVDSAWTWLASKPGTGMCSEPDYLDGGRIDFQMERGNHLHGRVLVWGGTAPVAGAAVDLRVVAVGKMPATLDLGTTSDRDGRFDFADLPPGSLFLRGHADGLDSNGYGEVKNEAAGALDVETDLWLAPMLEVRGQLTPWPLHGLDPRASIKVLAATTSETDEAFSASLWSGIFGAGDHTFRGEVEGDGRFLLPIGACRQFYLTLESDAVATQPRLILWHRWIEAGAPPASVDLGRIELSPVVRLEGHVDVPAAIAELGLVVGCSTGDEDDHVSFWSPLRRDGSFDVTAFPGNKLRATIVFDHQDVAESAAVEIPDRAGPGTRLEVGAPTLTRMIVAGRIVDRDGTPAAPERLELVQCDATGRDQRFYGAFGSEQGRYCIDVSFDEVHETQNGGEPDEENRHELRTPRADDRWFLAVTLPDRVRQLVPFQFPGTRGWARRDVVLDAGACWRGRLVDERDAPLAGWSLTLFDATQGEFADVVDSVTEADGSFAIDGIEDCVYDVTLRSPDGNEYRFKRRRLAAEATTLRLHEADEIELASSPDSTDAPNDGN